MKPINVPDPEGQTWGNLLLGPYSLDQGVPLLRTRLFLYSKRKQYFSVTGNFILTLNGWLTPNSQFLGVISKSQHQHPAPWQKKQNKTKKKPNTHQYCFSLIRKLMHDHQKIQTVEKLEKMRATILHNPHSSPDLTEIHSGNSLRWCLPRCSNDNNVQNSLLFLIKENNCLQFRHKTILAKVQWTKDSAAYIKLPYLHLRLCATYWFCVKTIKIYNH